ncbi:Venom peptide isomerase heavy chain [Halotydeus destructor]|nr:Venom peptide isomerase heavy chain [Halotydeus destructor]
MTKFTLLCLGTLLIVPLAHSQLFGSQLQSQNVLDQLAALVNSQPGIQLQNRLQRPPPGPCRLSTPGCGLRPGSRATWVFDDTLSYAKRGDVPWQVKLEVKGHSATWYCSGTVINPEWIIARGYCLYHSAQGDIGSDKIKVIANELNPFTANLTKNGNYFSVSDVKFHSDHPNELALVKMNRPLPRVINPLCLPENDRADHGVGKVSGWPQYVLNYLVSSSAMSFPYDHCTGLGNDKRSLLCVVSQGPPDCGMDNGSPFYRQERPNGPMVLVGIKLKDMKCRVSDSELSTERYLRVSSFLGWLSDTMGICGRPGSLDHSAETKDNEA